ncbi:hypothetical protein MNV49_004470 [Pseudohyphozyma bogoriensis]|nr:hypothetical protein MNV49_004470 [Pseudohyphozyma bogoriensis]
MPVYNPTTFSNLHREFAILYRDILPQEGDFELVNIRFNSPDPQARVDHYSLQTVDLLKSALIAWSLTQKKVTFGEHIKSALDKALDCISAMLTPGREEFDIQKMRQTLKLPQWKELSVGRVPLSGRTAKVYRQDYAGF